METVVVPYLEINLHVLSGHDAETVHVEMVEEGSAGLLLVEGHGNDELLFNGFLDQAIEIQLGKTVIISDEAREIHIGGKLFVEGFHADVGISVGEHIDSKTERVETAVPSVLHLHLKLGGLHCNKLILKNIVCYSQIGSQRVAGQSHLLGVAGQEAESERGALRDDESCFAFKGLVSAVDVTWITQIAAVRE